MINFGFVLYNWRKKKYPQNHKNGYRFQRHIDEFIHYFWKRLSIKLEHMMIEGEHQLDKLRTKFRL